MVEVSQRGEKALATDLTTNETTTATTHRGYGQSYKTSLLNTQPQDRQADRERLRVETDRQRTWDREGERGRQISEWNKERQRQRTGEQKTLCHYALHKGCPWLSTCLPARRKCWFQQPLKASLFERARSTLPLPPHLHFELHTDALQICIARFRETLQGTTCDITNELQFKAKSTSPYSLLYHTPGDVKKERVFLSRNCTVTATGHSLHNANIEEDV